MAPPSKELVQWWRPRLRALDPWREVGLDEIDDLYAERQASPYRDLATDLSIAVTDRPADLKFVLCGARGSGKSTELTRLAQEVNRDYCVVHTDLAAGLPDQASTLAVVTLLGVAVLHATQTWSAPDGDANALVRDTKGIVARGTERLQRALESFGDAAPSVSQLLESVSGLDEMPSPDARRSVLAEVREGLSRRRIDRLVERLLLDSLELE